MKKMFLIINVFILIFAMTISVSANGWPTNEVQKNVNSQDDYIQFTEDSVKEFDDVTIPFNDMDRGAKSFSTYTDNEDILPDVTIDDAIDWANKKGYEIISFLQVLVQPFAIIIFIISALFTLVGSIGRGDLSGKGLWGMVISVIVYAIVLYAPVIIQAFVSFFVS